MNFTKKGLLHSCPLQFPDQTIVILWLLKSILLVQVIKTEIYRNREKKRGLFLSHWDLFFKGHVWFVVFLWVFHLPEGFLIIHVQKRQCLVGDKTAIVGKCNLTDPNQQWRWTEDEKLLHVRSGQCLGISKSSAASSRSIFIDCPRAPSWIFHNTEGLLQVANTSLFLTKQGQRVMIKMGRKYPHSWKQIDVDDKGKTAYENLCPHKGELILSGSVLGVMVTILSLLYPLTF